MNHPIFPARYPGRCLCGATFQAGAKIAWDASVRRATLCPKCAAPKLIPGRVRSLSNGLAARFDLHPETREEVACILSDPCGAWGAVEVYRLRDGRWTLASFGREMVLTSTASHEEIEAWKTAA